MHRPTLAATLCVGGHGYLAVRVEGRVTAAGPPSDDAGPAVRRPPRLSKNRKIGLGLLLTFVGLFLFSALLPTSPGALARALPLATAAIAALWIGGILMGIGSRS
jgi:hypothetical protein